MCATPQMGMMIGGQYECGAVAAMGEAWLRTALALPSRPVPLFINCQMDTAAGSNSCPGCQVTLL
jgi:hypothetical protein